MDIDLNVILAASDLKILDALASDLSEDPVVREVSKAVTVAASHDHVEAVVTCFKPADFAKSQRLLSGKVCESENGKWDANTRTLELPNGSAVLVRARQLSQNSTTTKEKS
jgi:hypothetical protein